jgi:transposase
MQNEELQLETLNKTQLINYAKKLEIDNQQLHNKYFELKEQYDVLIYQKYVRSAEKLLDDKQQSLFVEEPEQTSVKEEETEKQEIKSYTRKKPGRKPLDPNLRRVEEIIDIPEKEKTCACGEKMTKIGEETSENLK